MVPMLRKQSKWRRAAGIGLALILGLGLWLAASPLAAQGDVVVVMEIDSPVAPAVLDYFERGIRTAERDGATAVLIQLNTPGGLVDVMQNIVALFRNADLPVIVYVAPAGAQAASAGAFVTLAAHAAGMAPETVIGAASPISGDGSDIGETAYRKLVSDLTAQMRTLTEDRGPEATNTAVAMIEDATTVTASEALEIGLIDAIATDRQDLLAQLDGRTVMVDGQPQALRTAGRSLVVVELTLAERLLLALTTSPLLISALLGIAVPAILIELQSPGGWVAGFIGAVCLALALYGLGQISANWLGLGLIIVAAALFLVEIQAPSGIAAAVGTITLLVGLLVLFNSPGTPDFARISIGGAVAVSLVVGGFSFFVMTKVFGVHRRQPRTGFEGLVGRTGIVRHTFKPAGDTFRGTVLVRGELWQARANDQLEEDAPIVVRDRSGFTLMVAPAVPEPALED